MNAASKWASWVRALAVLTIANVAMADMVYAVERGECPLGWHNLDELAALADTLGEPLALEA